MKRINQIVFLVFSIVFSFSFSPTSSSIELKGFIKNEAGYIVGNIKIEAFRKGVKICESTSDRYGNYVLNLDEEGYYDFVLAVGNNNYYTLKDTTVQILPLKVFRKDFILFINKQELQHITTRCHEAYRHLEKNPTNTYYKGIYFTRFPKSMDEMYLFFSQKIPYKNLKTAPQVYLEKFLNTRLVSDTSYFHKYANIVVDWTEQNDLKCFKYFNSKIAQLVKVNPQGFADILNYYYDTPQIKWITTQTVKDLNDGELDEIFNKLKIYNPRIYKIMYEVVKEEKNK